VIGLGMERDRELSESSSIEGGSSTDSEDEINGTWSGYDGN